MLFTNNLIFYFSIKNIGTIEKKTKKMFNSIEKKILYRGKHTPSPIHQNS